MYKGLDVSDKVVLVTGGTSGIGRAIALGCAEAGAKVVAGSTNPEKVSAIKAELARDTTRRRWTSRANPRSKPRSTSPPGDLGASTRSSMPRG